MNAVRRFKGLEVGVHLCRLHASVGVLEHALARWLDDVTSVLTPVLVDPANANHVDTTQIALWDEGVDAPQEECAICIWLADLQARHVELELEFTGIVSQTKPANAACRVGGCTDDRACTGGCSWVEPDLCSRCDGVNR